MPTHWESSERPLFVRTVVVNGSRHAILSHVDPLCQARKSDSSLDCLEQPNRKTITSRRVRSCYPFKRDITSELQKCLVKLRVVLSTQEQGRRLREVEETSREKWKRVRKRMEKSQKNGREQIDNKGINQEDITGFRRGNSYCKAIRKKECELNSEDIDCSNKKFNPPNGGIENPAKMSDHTLLMRRVLPLSETTEELLRNYSSYFFPIVYIKADGLIWGDVSGESASTKNVHNPLSERVLQWLDLARRRKESKDVEKSKSVFHNQSNVQEAGDESQNGKNRPVRCKSESSLNKTAHKVPDEDNEDEVKHESDIETVLSTTNIREYPKFSRDSNKLHIMKNDSTHQQTDVAISDEDSWEKIISIPEKTTSEFSLTEQLQQSILESFEAIVNLERKASLERVQKTHSFRRKSSREGRSFSGRASRKKSLLMKQTVIRISSDEEEKQESVFVKQRAHSAARRSGGSNGKKSWKCHGQRIMSANEESLEPGAESKRRVRIIYNETPLSAAEKNHGGLRIWATEKGANKPHLHIFMPGINPKLLETHEETASDIEVIVK